MKAETLTLMSHDSTDKVYIFRVLVLSGYSAHGYRMFADRIPNGVQVPHPCKPNVLWHGVGHFNEQGGGFRNPFGTDFYDAGKVGVISNM